MRQIATNAAIAAAITGRIRAHTLSVERALGERLSTLLTK
jgi:hypothetical protein